MSYVPPMVYGYPVEFYTRTQPPQNHPQPQQHPQATFARQFMDQPYGLGLPHAMAPEDSMLNDAILGNGNPTMYPPREYCNPRPWRNQGGVARDITSMFKTDNFKFQVNLDVQHYTPEEVSVKTVDGCVVVECKHEEKKDQHGYVSRQLIRRYVLPDNCDLAAVEANMSSDGVLIIAVPKKAPEIDKRERIVTITHTGAVRMNAKPKQTNVINGAGPGAGPIVVAGPGVTVGVVSGPAAGLGPGVVAAPGVGVVAGSGPGPEVGVVAGPESEAGTGAGVVAEAGEGK